MRVVTRRVLADIREEVSRRMPSEESPDDGWARRLLIGAKVFRSVAVSEFPLNEERC